jgi:hypothetical protein
VRKAAAGVALVSGSEFKRTLPGAALVVLPFWLLSSLSVFFSFPECSAPAPVSALVAAADSESLPFSRLEAGEFSDPSRPEGEEFVEAIASGVAKEGEVPPVVDDDVEGVVAVAVVAVAAVVSAVAAEA